MTAAVWPIRAIAHRLKCRQPIMKGRARQETGQFSHTPLFTHGPGGYTLSVPSQVESCGYANGLTSVGPTSPWACWVAAVRTTRRPCSARSSRIGPHAGGALACLSVRSGFDLLLAALDLPPKSEVLITALTIPDMVRIIKDHDLVPVPLTWTCARWARSSTCCGGRSRRRRRPSSWRTCSAGEYRWSRSLPWPASTACWSSKTAPKRTRAASSAGTPRPT